jgi:prefoldin alpha subunit
MKKEQQELMFRLAMFEQQIKQLQEQLQTIEQAILETSALSEGLDDIKGEKEILASIGKGIFVKAKLASEDLVVDIGSKNFVKKSIPETQKIINEQIKKLEEVKKELETKLEEVNHELVEIIREAQEKEK